MLRAYAHDRFTFPVPDHHRFPLAKYGLVRSLVEANPDVAIREGPPAAWDDVARVHHPEWVRRVRYGLLDRRELAGLGLPWSPALVTRTLHSCGSTTAAARASLEDGVAAALGGGMHHAGHRVGRGYCTFNDVAIAIATLRAERCAARVLILDLDVHQGDGNAELYAATPTPWWCRSTARGTTRSRGRRPISTSTSPTARATTPTWRRSTTRSRSRWRAVPTTWRC